MSQQSKLDEYFQKISRSPPIKTSGPSAMKRRSLSLIKSPHQYKYSNNQSTKNIDDAKPSKQDEIIVISDCEDGETNCDNPCDSETSCETIVYNLSPSILIQNSPTSLTSISKHSNAEYVFTSKQAQSTPIRCKSVAELENRRDTSPETFPIRNLSLPNIEHSPFKTPKVKKSGAMFYSPTKKRLVTNRSPAKKNLTQEFYNNHDQTAPDYDLSKVCETQDDKTIFLMTMIEQYLKNDSLRCLLDDDSNKILAKCMHIAKPGMKLTCRLYWHQRGWYRTHKLIKMCGEDNIDIHKLNLSALIENGLIVQSATQGENCMGFDEGAKLLTVQELQGICKNFKIKNPTKKDEMIQALKKFSKRKSIAAYISIAKPGCNERVLNMIREKAGPCYKLSELASNTLNSLYVLMYLGIDYSLVREKKLEFMLINDKIGRETYPVDKNMAIDNASVVFQNRHEFKEYMTALSMYEEYLAETDIAVILNTVHAAYNLYQVTDEDEMQRYKSFPLWLRRYTSPSIYISILENGIQHLKSQKSKEAYKFALDILKLLIEQITYRQHKKLDWYEEMALILHKHMNQPEKAAKYLLKGFALDMSEGAKDILRPRARLLAEQLNISLPEMMRAALQVHADRQEIEERNLPADHIMKQPLDNYNQRGKQKFEHRTEDGRTQMSAEDYCVMHYTSQQGEFTHGAHWEGRIVTTIYFLLFWDIIYMKPVGVTGIFLSYYQKYPLDLFYESFYINRRTLIEERLALIEQCTENMLIGLMEKTWDTRPKEEVSEICRDLGWDNVRMVAQCAGPQSLAAICRRLAMDYRGSHSGFPDLTLWNIHTKKVKFVEVKTDADKPSMKQIKWLRYLIDHGIDAGFCYIGANTTRNRKRGHKVASSPGFTL